MNAYTILELEEFIKIFAPISEIETGITVLEMVDDRDSNLKNERLLKLISPIMINAISFVFVLKGEIDITIDYKKYKICANHIVDTGSQHIIENVKYYPGMSGYHILIDKPFCEEVLQERSPLSFNYVLPKRTHPICQISDSQTSLLNRKIRVMAEDIKRTDHVCYNDLIKSNIAMFMMEVTNCAHFHEKENRSTYIKSRKDIIVSDFIKVVSNRTSKDLSIDYIANKLCITPQYLSQVLKEKTGKNTSQWIASTKITEAKILLRHPNMSIGEIADKLKFSDLSSFSKFFKKNCGISPLQYKNRN